ncbi:cyclopropane-fatty-acyl-phospholipid synthase family protein [Mesorhizobium sp. CAU 1741]|uniref:cyclopropane-fatty-acyl-phospholipid synthase family protein n=1 Tax=Mesorhizobium sp. CAU 1741 TaxID=3140366 RepID=UPI00325B23D4
MNRVLQRIVGRLVRTGSLTVTDPDGTVDHFGDGSGPRVHVVIKTQHAQRAIAFDPMLAVPEAFMNGEIDVVEGDVLELLHLVYENMGPAGVEAAWTKAVEGLRIAFRRLQQVNTAARAKRNVEHHYNLSREFYQLFLDEDMQYSCAYFERPDMSLEEAQLAKKRHIAAKLCLKPGQQVLDIGSGWGGLALYLASTFDVDVLGVTLSSEQHVVATDRAHDEGLQSRAHFEIRDYRDLQERFDRIVSVGMFEHVGVNHYRAFFDRVSALLKPDGVVVLHSIGRAGPPAATNAFIRKHIFPGGYIPALSEVLPHIEKAGLMVTDVEILRLHYADTLKHWRERFMANRDRVVEIYDERFARMWEFYLAGSEAAFRWQDLMVFQIQLTLKNDTTPVTRGYMGKCEKALAMRDSGRQPPKASRARKSARKVADQE